MSARTPEHQLPRCCAAHHDWSTLAAHLADAYPEVDVAVVLRELVRARDGATSMGLEEADAIATAEVVTRQQLMLLTERVEDLARLDPERHVRGN